MQEFQNKDMLVLMFAESIGFIKTFFCYKNGSKYTTGLITFVDISTISIKEYDSEEQMIHNTKWEPWILRKAQPWEIFNNKFQLRIKQIIDYDTRRF